MTLFEWVVLAILGLRLALVRPRRGALATEALADAPLVLPCFFLQEMRVFPLGSWTLPLPGGTPALAVAYGVAVLGAAITLAEHLHTALGRAYGRDAAPSEIAAVDFIVLAGVSAVFESLFSHAGGWTYRYAGPFGYVPGAGIPWAAVIGVGGFGFFFAPTIRQYRRWTADALGRLAVHGRIVLGLVRPETGAISWAGGGVGAGLRRTLGAAVLRLLDL